MKRHLILVGISGSGKNTVGRLAAKQLRTNFSDIDELIVAGSGQPVAELFARDGVPSEENALDAEELERVLAGLACELASLITPPAAGNVTR